MQTFYEFYILFASNIHSSSKSIEQVITTPNQEHRSSNVAEPSVELSAVGGRWWLHSGNEQWLDWQRCKQIPLSRQFQLGHLPFSQGALALMVIWWFQLLSQLCFNNPYTINLWLDIWSSTQFLPNRLLVVFVVAGGLTGGAFVLEPPKKEN